MPRARNHPSCDTAHADTPHPPRAAGASTPQWIIDAVCGRIKVLQSEQA